MDQTFKLDLMKYCINMQHLPVAASTCIRHTCSTFMGNGESKQQGGGTFPEPQACARVHGTCHGRVAGRLTVKHTRWGCRRTAGWSSKAGQALADPGCGQPSRVELPNLPAPHLRRPAATIYSRDAPFVCSPRTHTRAVYKYHPTPLHRHQPRQPSLFPSEFGVFSSHTTHTSSL
jgi:hypothetical protein